MRDVLLKEILSEYQVIRQRGEQELRDREAEVYRKIPEILSLRNNMYSLLAEHSKNQILNTSSKVNMEELSHQITILKDKETALLLQEGYPNDYLMLQFRCPVCQDTGYVGDPVLEKCRCLLQRLIDVTYGASEIRELETQNFDAFDPTVFPLTPLNESGFTQRANMLKIRDELMSYQASFPVNSRKNILFTGQTGLGKTFLLNCLAKALLDRGYTVLKITSYNLFEQLFRSNLQSDAETQGMRDRIFHVDCLMLDDLGTETRRNNYTAETLFNILNERFLYGRHTVLSTNLALNELKERYSERVTSRLFDTGHTMIIRFLGQDIRLRKNESR